MRNPSFTVAELVSACEGLGLDPHGIVLKLFAQRDNPEPETTQNGGRWAGYSDVDIVRACRSMENPNATPRPTLR